jgi:Family of unknown function (DUF5313)
VIRPLPAAPAFEHAGHQLGNPEVGATNVGVERGLEGRHVLIDGECRGKAGSVVDDDVDITRLQRKLLYRVEISEVGLYEAESTPPHWRPARSTRSWIDDVAQRAAAWYTFGGALGPRYRQWVLHELTCRTRWERQIGRAVVQVVPLAMVLLLVPGLGGSSGWAWSAGWCWR